MASHTADIRRLLSEQPCSARYLIDKLQISQPTLSREIATIKHEILRLGAARSIQYALRDRSRGLNETPIYQVGIDGKVSQLGLLIPVCPDGYVIQKVDGKSLCSEGLPWWLMDMCPQGYLGRIFVSRYSQALGLSSNLSEWTDSNMLRALILYGDDAVGNLLVGELSRERFLNSPELVPIARSNKGELYQQLAKTTSLGELPGSSAGGEQPKFTAYSETEQGAQHVIVKFTLQDKNPVTERWRDLLLTEHHALETLAQFGIPAAKSNIVDYAGQRFLEVQRFDRIGLMGRRAVFSLTAIDAEFVGEAYAPWPVITNRLLENKFITRESAETAALLYAFGILIGNSDMHNGNLSFSSENQMGFSIAPAYDMLTMGFAPKASGQLNVNLNAINLHPSVSNAIWKQALALAERFFIRLHDETRWTNGFQDCFDSLARHIDEANKKIARLG